MKKYITKAFLLTMILTGVVSCQKEEDRVFDKPVSERLSEQEKKLQDLLLSSEYGWKLVYNTSEGDFGSYTYLMRFKDSRNVEMVSDFTKNGSKPETTEYSIQQRATTSLVFTTRAKIHELSDPINSPYAAGKGYYGEYQFGYYGNTESTIDFRSPKQDQKVTFVKATKEDWDTFSQNYTMVEKMNSISEPYFRVLEIESGGTKESIDFNNYGVVRLIELANNNLIKEEVFGLAYNPKGIVLSPPMDVKGQKISSFIYDASTNAFIGKEGDVKVSIKYSKNPAVWTDMSYKKLLPVPGNVVGSTFTFRTANNLQLFGSSITSELLKQEIAAMGKDAAGQYNVSFIDFTFNANIGLPVNANYVEYTYKGKKYLYFFSFVDMKDRVKIVPIQWNNSSTVPNEIKNLNTLILGEDVYFRLEPNKIQYTNPVLTFISTKAPISFPTWDTSVPNKVF